MPLDNWDKPPHAPRSLFLRAVEAERARALRRARMLHIGSWVVWCSGLAVVAVLWMIGE